MIDATIQRILVVEDDQDLAPLIVECLVDSGLSVTACSDGIDALDMLSRHTFDLVLTDISMPRMTGLDLLKEMRRRGDLTAVIFMTGYGDQPATMTALKLGAVDFLEKPVQVSVMIERVYKALDIGRREREADASGETNRRLIGLLRVSNLK